MLCEGQIVGAYRLLKKLGEGGMGVVFAAEHQVIERRAAIKVLHPEISRDPEVAARFVNEARAPSRVRHPGLCEVYDLGTCPMAART